MKRKIYLHRKQRRACGKRKRRLKNPRAEQANKKWMKTNIKINHFDKVKGRQEKSARCAFFDGLPSFAFTGSFSPSFSSCEVCWLKEKLLPKCNLNLRCYPQDFPARTFQSVTNDLEVSFARQKKVFRSSWCVKCINFLRLMHSRLKLALNIQCGVFSRLNFGFQVQAMLSDWNY